MRNGKQKLWIATCVIAVISLFYLIRLKRPTQHLQNSLVTFRFQDYLNDSLAYVDCTIDTCVDLLPCAIFDNRLTVYVEPLISVVDEYGRRITPEPSREFLKLRSIILNSQYSVKRLEDACLVIPGFDTLNLLRFPYPMALYYAMGATLRYRSATPLLFVFVGTRIPAGKAIVARSQTLDTSFRQNYDVAIPFWFQIMSDESIPLNTVSSWFLTILLTGISDENKEQVKKAYGTERDILLLDECDGVSNNLCDSGGQPYELSNVLKKSEFLMLFEETIAFEWLLTSALRFSTIPVIVCDRAALPFGDVIDWSKLSFSFYFESVGKIFGILKALEPARLKELKKQSQAMYRRYFNSVENIALTTLKLLQIRLIPNSIVYQSEWNQEVQPPPLFVSRIAPLEGFTAVVFCKGETELLFSWLQVLDKVQNLAAIVIIWPKGLSAKLTDFKWHHLKHPTHLIFMEAVQPSVRFIKFEEITTEAVFSVTEQFSLLTVEQIEFGYQLWRDSPNRLVVYSVGLSDLNAFNQSKNLYSPWMELNLLFEGCFFYHKYYDVLYHKSLSNDAKETVDNLRTCDDIATARFLHQFDAIAVVKIRPKKLYCKGCQYKSFPSWHDRSMTDPKQCVLQLRTSFQAKNRKHPVYMVSADL